MERFSVIQGGGCNPIKKDSLPSIIHMDIPRNEAERLAQECEVIEHDRLFRGFRGVIFGEIERSSGEIERSYIEIEDVLTGEIRRVHIMDF